MGTPVFFDNRISPSGGPLSAGERIAAVAAEAPDRIAVVELARNGTETALTWRELDRDSNRLANGMREQGVCDSSLVAVGLPNTGVHIKATVAAWKLGACVLPLNPRLPRPERARILKVANPTIVLDDHGGVAPVTLMTDDAAHPPYPVPSPGKAIASGGSTGKAKIIVDPSPWGWVPGEFPPPIGRAVRLRQDQIQLVAGPLSHNTPFTWAMWGLLARHELILMERFDAATALEAIDRHQVEFMALVPTMMRRIMLLSECTPERFRSVQSVFHTAAPCAPSVKRAWIELVGAQNLYEGFGATEAVGYTFIRGDEWLEHPGSVGRARDSRVKIRDPDGQCVPAGEVGEIFMKPDSARPTFRYLGADQPPATADGYVSVGDLGWLEQDGYLYLADRRTDLIITGGSNVYPAEIEGILLEHRGVADVAVVGLLDEDRGRSVHAIVQPAENCAAPSADELTRHCMEALSSYKVPRSFEFVDRLPRDAAGKLRRSGLVEQRMPGSRAHPPLA